MSSSPPNPEAALLRGSTRTRLFARLADVDRPISANELAAELGRHPSGVRVHLERLRAAGLISRERLPQATGRPRYGWRVTPQALPREGPPDAYRQLARWLARAIPPRPVRLHEVERAGRAIGREAAGDRGRSEPVKAMTRVLTALGFAPDPEFENNGRVVFTLGRCPYREAVRDNPPIVCTLHRAMTEGLLEVLDPSARLANFVAKDRIAPVA
jgi:predicted ArsR family transcriptional regulator